MKLYLRHDNQHSNNRWTWTWSSIWVKLWWRGHCKWQVWIILAPHSIYWYCKCGGIGLHMSNEKKPGQCYPGKIVWAHAKLKDPNSISDTHWSRPHLHLLEGQTMIGLHLFFNMIFLYLEIKQSNPLVFQLQMALVPQGAKWFEKLESSLKSSKNLSSGRKFRPTFDKL